MIFASIALGLLWRSKSLLLNPFLEKYGGDAIWAFMIFFLLAFIFETPATRLLVALSILTIFAPQRIRDPGTCRNQLAKIRLALRKFGI